MRVLFRLRGVSGYAPVTSLRGALAQVGDVVLNLKMTLFDNGKRRYFKLKKTLQFSEMTLQ